MEKEKPDQKSQVFFLFYGKNTWRLRGAWLYWKMSWEVFSLVYYQLVQKNERKIFIPYQKRDEKGNQSNAQRSRKSSRLQRSLHKKDW